MESNNQPNNQPNNDQKNQPSNDPNNDLNNDPNIDPNNDPNNQSSKRNNPSFKNEPNLNSNIPKIPIQDGFLTNSYIKSYMQKVFIVRLLFSIIELEVGFIMEAIFIYLLYQIYKLNNNQLYKFGIITTYDLLIFIFQLYYSRS